MIGGARSRRLRRLARQRGVQQQSVDGILTDLFQVPTTVARFGDRLATVNAKFDTGLPPTADQYEVVVVDR